MAKSKSPATPPGAAKPGDDLPEIDFKGQTYRLGTLLPDQYPATLPKLSAAPGFVVWDRATILEAVKRKPGKKRNVWSGRDWILNQAGRGSCNAAALCGALRRAMAVGGRNEVPQLSWEFGYAQINGGKDNGSMLDDGMREVVLGTGLPVLNPQKHPLNKHIRKDDYSPEEYNEATKYRGEGCYEVEDEDQLATVLLSGQGAGVVAVHVGSKFTKLNADGVAGVDSGPGNHAVGVDDVEVIGGKLAFDMFNSWDLSYGEGGRAYLTESHFKQTRKYHAFYVIYAASNPADGAPVVKE